jgi:hypothetical protein
LTQTASARQYLQEFGERRDWVAGGFKDDFFLSRRGSVATVAREVADVLIENDYKVIVRDYDIPLGASFIEAMHEGVKNARDLTRLKRAQCSGNRGFPPLARASLSSATRNGKCHR